MGRFVLGHRIASVGLLVSLSVSAQAAPFDRAQGSTVAVPQENRPPSIPAAGLRGLIDPGGYAAPANAAAASGLIAALADMQREGNTRALAASGQVFCQVQGLLIRQQFDRAAAVLNALPEEKKDADFHRLLAQAHEGTGRFEMAESDYRAAAQQSSDESDFFGAGYEALLGGSVAKADAAFADGLVKRPQASGLLLGKGAAAFLLGRSGEAVQRFLEVASTNPSDARPYAFLGLCVDFFGDHADQARGALKHHLETSANDAKAHELYALALLHSDAPDETQIETLLKQAIALDRKLVEAHFQLGMVYAHQENTEGSIQQFQAVLQIDPGIKEAHYRLASAYRRAGRTEDAEREMKLFRATQGSDASTDISRYISVWNSNGRQPPREPNACPIL